MDLPTQSCEPFYRAADKQEFIVRCQDCAPPEVREWFDAEIAFVVSILPACARVVDVGCGPGRVLRGLRGCGRRVLGVDVNLTAVRAARDRLQHERASGCQALIADGLELPLRDGTVDVATFLINTLGNFGPRKADFLREAWRVLRPGGLLIASVYSLAADRIQRRWYGELCRLGIMGPVDEERSSPHVLATRDGYVSERFDRPSLAAVFAAAGLRASVHEIRELLIAVAPR